MLFRVSHCLRFLTFTEPFKMEFTVHCSLLLARTQTQSKIFGSAELSQTTKYFFVPSLNSETTTSLKTEQKSLSVQFLHFFTRSSKPKTNVGSAILFFVLVGSAILFWFSHASSALLQFLFNLLPFEDMTNVEPENNIATETVAKIFWLYHGLRGV